MLQDNKVMQEYVAFYMCKLSVLTSFRILAHEGKKRVIPILHTLSIDLGFGS